MTIRRLSVAAAAGAVLLLGACSWDNQDRMQAPASASLSPAELLGAMSAKQVVDALPKAGLAAVNPVDSTAAECPIVTDGFRVLSFPSTSAAENYAAAHAGARQIETLAVLFAPNVPTAEQDRYWSAIVNLVH
jgi:hypothetical protein